jgi:hypothetical protein
MGIDRYKNAGRLQVAFEAADLDRSPAVPAQSFQKFAIFDVHPLTLHCSAAIHSHSILLKHYYMHLLNVKSDRQKYEYVVWRNLTFEY